ncbi:MAG: hypothetical protein KJ574_03820 [Nanoarchaeota archaeon]|nr:hypothetical protein [Nanoarchaeota archaeon]
MKKHKLITLIALLVILMQSASVFACAPPSSPPTAQAPAQTPTTNTNKYIQWYATNDEGYQFSVRADGTRVNEFARRYDPETGQYSYFKWNAETGKYDDTTPPGAQASAPSWTSPTTPEGQQGGWEFSSQRAKRDAREGDVARVTNEDGTTTYKIFQNGEWVDAPFQEPTSTGAAATTEGAAAQAGAGQVAADGAQAQGATGTAAQAGAEAEEEALEEAVAKECPACQLEEATRAISAGESSMTGTQALEKLKQALADTETNIQTMQTAITKRDPLLAGAAQAGQHIASGEWGQVSQGDINSLAAMAKDDNDVFSDAQQAAAQALLNEIATQGEDDKWKKKEEQPESIAHLGQFAQQLDNAAQQQELDAAALQQAIYERDVAKALQQRLAAGMTAEQVQQQLSWEKQVVVREQLSYNSLGADLRAAASNPEKVQQAWGDYYSRIYYGTSGDNIDNFVHDQTSTQLRSLVMSNEDYDWSDKNKDGLVDAGEVTQNGEEISLDELTEKAQVQVEKMYGISVENDAEGNLQSLAESMAARHVLGTAAGQQFFVMPEGQIMAQGSQLAQHYEVNSENKIIAHFDGGNEMDTGIVCYDCNTAEGGVLQGNGLKDGARLQFPDGTVYDYSAEDAAAGRYPFRARKDYWVQGSLVDWLSGGPVTQFLKGLSSMVGTRCRACKGNWIYEAFGKIDLAQVATEGICDENVEGLGETFAISKTGGPSQAWVTAEVVTVGDICGSLTGDAATACGENMTPAPYMYKLQAVVNAQEVKMVFNICLTDSKGDCSEGSGKHVWNLLRLRNQEGASIATDLILDPSQDPEFYGPPILDWHGPYTKVFPGFSQYQYVCIKFANADYTWEEGEKGLKGILILDGDHLCNRIADVNLVSPYDPDRRQWEGVAGSEFAQPTAGAGYVAPGGLGYVGTPGGASQQSGFDPGGTGAVP